MKSAIRTSAFGVSRKRRLLQCGTALPLLLAAWPALAEPIVEHSATDVTVDAASASGTPVAVELESTGGAVGAKVTTVTATSVAGDRDYVVGLETGANGGITGNFGSITATGAGEVLGLGAQSIGGAIDLTVGTVDVDGTASSGITAHSVDGAVTISAESVISRGTEMDSQGEFFEAVQGVSDNGSVTIDVGHAETYGFAGSAIGAIAGGTASVTADSAVAHAEGVIVAYANAAGDVAVDIGSVTLAADDGQGVRVSSSGGSATVAVGAIETGDLAEAARVTAAGDINVALGDVNAGGGLTATSNSGNVTVTLDGDLVGRTFGGMGLTGQNVTVNMAEGSSITAAGADGTGWNGIFASAPGSIDIVATEIATTGDNGHAINVQGGAGPVSVNSESITTAGSGAYGVNVTTAGGDAQIISGTVATTGAGQVFGISAVTNGGGISIDSGTVEVASTGADNGRGIQANSGGGDIVIKAGTTTGHTRAIYTTTLFSGPDQGFTAGNTTITSESATATGGNAIIGQGYSVALTSGRAEGTANANFTAATIYVSAGEGGAAVTADQTLGHGYGQYGIQVLANGDLQLNSGSVTTDGVYANGITVLGDSAIAVTSGTVATLGADSHGIYVDGYTEYGADPVSVTSEAITTAGDRSDGIFVWSFLDGAGAMTGDITIDSGSIGTDGALSHGIVVASAADPGYSYRRVSASAGTGTLAVTSGTIIADGEGGRGIVFDHAGPISLSSGSITADAGGIYMWAGSTVDVTSDTVVTRAGPGIVVYGTGDVSLDAGMTEVGADGDTGIYVETTTGNIAIAADSTATNSTEILHGFTADGVLAVSTQGGNIAIDSGTASVRGEYAWGVGAVTDGEVTIASDTVATSGLGGVGIYGEGRVGGVTIGSGAVSTSGDEAHGIQAVSNSGHIAINSIGGIATAGDAANGIQAISQNGTVDVQAGDVTVTGTDSVGILARSRETSITVDGTVSSAGLAVNALGFGTAEIDINGAVASADGAAIFEGGQNGIVRVAEGASVTAAQAGVVLSGLSQTDPGFFQVYNEGTIDGSVAVFVNVLPNTPAANVFVQNDGTMVGTSGLAVVTAGGDDVFELTNNSQVTGIADLGAGFDILALGFNDGVTEGVGQVAATVNVEHLSLSSGTWRAATGNSFYQSIAIDEGSHLIVAQDNEFITVIAPYIALDGRLDLELTTDTEPGQLTGLLVEGAGSVHLTGPATLLVDDATGLQHTGGTFVENGELLLTTVYGGDIATSGEGVFELGEGGDFTGNLVNDGTFVFTQAGDYDFLGDFTGTGQLDKNGEGTLTFAGLYGFEGTTSVYGGTVAFTGQLSEDTELDISEGTVDLSEVEGGEQTIAELAGEGGELRLGETNLVVDQTGNSAFAGQISGTGTLEKQGEGDLKLEGDGTGFTGTGQVGGGTLSVNGDFSNANFVVNQGGTLGGRGTIGETSVNGGTLAPGNSIDTLTVNGDVTFTAASVFEVEVNAAGQGDRLDATGTATLGGAQVQVIAENATYRPMTDYTILTAAGGISGTFASVSDNLAFLDPSLIYSANAVTLRLVRNDIDFAAFGATPNQAAIGGLIESFGYGNTLYNETLLLADGSVAPSFASLTGEVYPTHSAALIETAEMLRRQTVGAATGEGAFLWATGLYNTVEGGSMDLDGQGVAGGFGYGAGGFTAAAGLGLLDQGDGGADYLDGDLTFAVAHVGYDWMSGLSVSAGVQFGWADATTRRQTALGAINGAVAGEIDGDYLQLFGELAYRLSLSGGLELEPFAGISHVSADLDPVAESGAATALAVSGIERDVTFADIGLRLSGEVGSGVRPFASAAYRHAWGDRASVAAVGFAGTAGSTLIAGLPVAESAAELSAGLVVTSGAVDFEVGYDGTISDTFDSHGVSAGIRFRF